MAANDNSGDNSGWDRPDERLIADAYRLLFGSLTRERLRENAANGALMPQKFEFGAYGLAGRSLAWKALLMPAPPLTTELSQHPVPPLAEIRRRRDLYVDVLRDLMQAPDGNYEEGFILPGHSRPPTPALKTGTFEKNNPLSLDEQNPWKQWFENVDLRKTIRQDVQRTFPDLSYFREPEVQSDLTNILFLHAAKHPEIGYRQGMHEILAAIFLAVDYDSLDRWTSSVDDRDILEMCDRTWVAADAWSLFGLVMNSMNIWFEWREPTGAPKETENGLNPYVAPIVTTSNRIQNQYLSNVDPTLWRKMSELGIEPQLFLIRWLRLLFSREFGFRETMILWDGLFALDPSLELAQWICVAMLVRIRNQLLPSDYSEQLTYLLRYPAAEGGALHVSLLLQQAVRLSQEPNTSTGASIVLQNRNLLGIPIEVPEPPARPTPRRRGDRPQQQQTSIRTPTEKRESPQPGFPELIARNIIDKSESLGINRAIFNTVSEIRRNWTEIPSAFSRSYTASSTDLPSLSYSQNNPSPDLETPVWEGRGRSDIEMELAALRNQQKTLAHAMTWAVNALLKDSDRLGSQNREALDCLSYARDVLMTGNVMKLDQDRLVSHAAPPPPPKEAQVGTQIPPSNEAPTPSVMLSKRDYQPPVGLTRTPHVIKPEVSPLHTTPYHRPSASSFASSTPSQERPRSTASSAPPTASPRYITSPTSPTPRSSGLQWQHSPPSMMSATHRKGGDAQHAAIATPSTPSYGYPPKSLSSAGRSNTTSTDPLGALQ
ncbi:SubName: Full=Related to molybdenum cofactor biosynthetic protein {ECO:0000313/EMBL:CCA66895.1} [Serendipita indica DSM 11827]|uniref:Related to molybdenum cofactor biosynthetic protein n=1 Tax=Serendipita indica (strain DSM 11827) TaxID=1109443 RepID=G4T6H6_SERID|nr:SubName: Full=Related to molybdenum cofactor biosynthetic protein {ECO:0000313/EMBL:CCA66895.1} [Serendipita indica DSM 11827]CCA66895.1 related to molybdenum cofactor biosynthetic protein [Serendipita indica DSM 11827]